MSRLHLSLVATLAMMTSAAGPGNAAEMEIFDFGPVGGSVIQVKGPIERGDSDRFYELAREAESAMVFLNSPGGLVNEGLSIAAEVHARGFQAVVDEGAECASICAVIWAGARHRSMHVSAIIAPHAAYERILQPDDSWIVKESGVANAEVGAFLTHAGLSRNAIRYFTLAPPEGFHLVTPEIARRLDIDTDVSDGKSLETAAERPTPSDFARQAATYVFLSGDCAHLPQMDGDYLKEQGGERLRMGHEIFGGEIFVELLPQMTEGIKETRARVALADWCMDAAMDLISERLPLGISGPGFDCSKANSTTEQAICGDAALSLQDRALGSIYAVLRGKSTEMERPVLLDKQRAWITARNRCGADVACINDRYRSWFIDLSQPGAFAR